MKIHLPMLLSLATLTTSAMSAPAEADRTQWFREARFGMFIHWGVYAVPAGEWEGQTIKGIGEWFMRFRKIAGCSGICFLREAPETANGRTGGR